MAIDRQELKEAFMACLEDDAIFDRLCDRLSERIEATVNFAVAEAVADKDRKIQELEEELQETADQVNELEQYSREQCINVNGVPEKQNENVAQLVLEIARAAGAELSPSDVDAAHRVGRPRDGKHRAIIVRFVSFTARQRVYDRRRELRDLTAERGPQSSLTTAELKNVFISGSLTKRNEETMYNARQLKKQRKIWGAWTDNGKMKIKLEKNAPTRIIRSTQNLRDLVGDGPDAAPRAGGPGAASAAGGSGRADLSRGNEGSARGRRLLPASRQLPPRLGVRGRQTDGPADQSPAPVS